MEAAADDTCFVSQAYGTLGKKTQPCLEPFFFKSKNDVTISHFTIYV